MLFRVLKVGKTIYWRGVEGERWVEMKVCQPDC